MSFLEPGNGARGSDRTGSSVSGIAIAVTIAGVSRLVASHPAEVRRDVMLAVAILSLRQSRPNRENIVLPSTCESTVQGADNAVPDLKTVDGVVEKTSPILCPSPRIHAATLPGRYCTRCGAQAWAHTPVGMDLANTGASVGTWV